MTGRRAKRLGGLFAVWLAAQALAPQTAANGWEHWSIPLDVLLASLTSGQPEYQSLAARSLGMRGEKAAVPALLAIIERTDSPTPIAMAAAEALGRIGDAGALVRLHHLLRNDTRPELRAEAATAVGRIAASGSLPVLLDVLARDSSILVRGQVVDALGAFADARSVQALVGVWGDERQPALRPRAIRALGSVGELATKPLMTALTAAQNDVERGEAVDALGRVRAIAAVPHLSALLPTVRDAGLRARIAGALGAIQNGDAVAALLPLLADESRDVAGAAVAGLAAAGAGRAWHAGPNADGGSAAGRAAAALRDLDRRLADAMARRDAVSEPGAMIADLALRIAVLTTLVEHDAAGTFDHFAAAAAPRPAPRDSALGLRLNEGIYELRRIAIVGLGYSKAPAALDRLRGADALGDGDFRLRATAVRALGVLGDAAAVPALLSRLRDPAAEVRWEAALVLGRIGGKSAPRAIALRLRDDDAEVRRQAVLALANLQAREFAGRIGALAHNDPSPEVRAAAATAHAVIKAAR